jgi:hypothetical protein
MILVFSIASLLWTLDVTHGINMIIGLCMCFWMLRNFPRIITKPETLRNVFLCIFLVSFVMIITNVLSKEHYDFAYEKEIFKGFDFSILLHAYVASANKVRQGGFAPVDLAANIINLAIFINIYFMLTGSWRRRVFLAIHTLLLLFCMFKTASKAGMLTLMMGMGFLTVIIPRFRDKVIRIAIVGIMFFVMAFLIVGEVLLKRFEAMQEGTFLDDRLGWWKKGFNHLFDSYGIGVGAGGFPKVIDPIPAAHSAYFSVTFEFGFIGIILFTSIVAVLLKRIIGSLSSIVNPELKFASYCLFTQLFVTAVHSLIDLDYNYLPIWLVFSLLMSICAISETERKRLERQT